MIGRQRFSPMLRCCPGCPPAGPRIADLGPGFNFVGFKTEDRFSSGQLDWWFERAPQLMPANLHTHMVASRNSRLDLASQPPAPVPPPPPPPVRCAACCHWRRVLGAWQRPAVPMPHATAGAVLTLPPPPECPGCAGRHLRHPRRSHHPRPQSSPPPSQLQTHRHPQGSSSPHQRRRRLFSRTALADEAWRVPQCDISCGLCHGDMETKHVSVWGCVPESGALCSGMRPCRAGC
jgi:hypothetical protein